MLRSLRQVMGTTDQYQDFDQAQVKDAASKRALGTDDAKTITTKQMIQEMIAQFVQLSFHEYADVRYC